MMRLQLVLPILPMCSLCASASVLARADDESRVAAVPSLEFASEFDLRLDLDPSLERDDSDDLVSETRIERLPIMIFITTRSFDNEGARPCGHIYPELRQ